MRDRKEYGKPHQAGQFKAAGEVFALLYYSTPVSLVETFCNDCCSRYRHHILETMSSFFFWPSPFLSSEIVLWLSQQLELMVMKWTCRKMNVRHMACQKDAL